ncbi:hypothetical protein K450DRAFT_239612 [Umbelopsis ramanniana AG]|uniref:Stress-associated endoplasmic reticulum protein n=1 Tax=Umbelopsis ramanniana AG TaxID=1314678 RepID=A0AAD5EBG6_UMBRA|nr:uncharacterized protein K450DRAFT_239612 [Umbelopsis ramanniana AG]KAI8579896.1 hypothetical protein K450DRAFT_239612 [Umbelopsis ramanniana AG]
MASTATLRKKNATYQNNVHKRGHVKDTLKTKKDWQLPVSLPVLAILAFTVFGGAFLAIMQMFF